MQVTTALDLAISIWTILGVLCIATADIGRKRTKLT